jgi:ABC-type Fe3+-hydroxamate transport system substrate-binding protein
MDELMRSAGSVDVLASGGPWQTLGFEEIAGLDPDVLVDASLAGGAAASRVTALAPGWKDVRAVRERHVIAISDPRVLRPGPRVAQRLALLARALHPHADLPEP